MERAKVLRELMEKKSFKVADIVRISGLPYSTVKYMLENGIEKATYTNVQKICSALGITADDLENMANSDKVNSEPKTIAAHFDGSEYTEDELEEIKQFAEFVKNKRK